MLKAIEEKKFDDLLLFLCEKNRKPFDKRREKVVKKIQIVEEKMYDR